MGSIESVEKKEGQCYSLSRRNLNIEETIFSTRSPSQGNTDEMKKRSAKTSIKKMSGKEISEKTESSDEALSKKDDEHEVIEVCEEEEEKNVGDKVEGSETNENEVSAERNKAKKQKKSPGGGNPENGETNDDSPVEESKNQGKDSKKAPQRKGNKKTKKGKRKKEEKDDEDNASDVDYEVEKILEVRTLKNGKKEYLIQWKGFSSKYNSWESEANLDCEDLIKEYFDESEKVIGKSGKEEANESESSSKIGSKSSESRRKPTGRKRRLSEGKAKEAQEQSRSNRSRMSKRGDATTEQTGSTERVTRSSRGRKTNETVAKYKRKREEQSEGPLPGRSLRGGKSRKSEKDQNKENFGENEGESDRGSGSDESRDSGVDAAEYEVEKIVDVRCLENGSREFLIKWKGFSSKDNSWEPEKHLNCDAKVKKFLQGAEQNSSARELRFERKRTDRFTLQSQGYQRKLSSRLEKMPRKSYKEVD